MPEMIHPIDHPLRSKEISKANYDRLSRWYDLLSVSREKKIKMAGLEKLNVQEGEAVLEIGFGTGHCLVSLAQSVGRSGKVYGMDISEGMLNIACSRVKKAGLTHRVDLELGDAAELQLEDDTVDAIFCSFALEIFEPLEIPIVLKECKRILRDKGRICIVAMSRKGKHTFPIKMYEWFHTRFPDFVDCRPIHVQKTLEDTGFKILDATTMSLFGLPVEVVLAQQ